jgi:hypothetical protein
LNESETDAKVSFEKTHGNANLVELQSYNSAEMFTKLDQLKALLITKNEEEKQRLLTELN